MSPQELDESLFPFNQVRKEQDKLMLLVSKVLAYQKNLVVHAPTGLGKTAAVLSPSLSYALDHDLTVLFLTSRHTQHAIAIETLQKIKKKFGNEFQAVSLIGKKHMCAKQGVSSLFSNEFADYCKTLREEDKCEFYCNTERKNALTQKAKNVLANIKIRQPLATEKVIEFCSLKKVCPYYISLAAAAKSRVIITDYYYLFHPDIRETVLQRIKRSPGELIVVVDEAHNLPDRIKDLASEYLTSRGLGRAIAEAKKFRYRETAEMLTLIQNILIEQSRGMQKQQEKRVNKEDFMHLLQKTYDYEQLIADLEFIGDAVREIQKQSSIGAVGRFLDAWKGPDKGFVRILSLLKEGFREPIVMLSYRCLDPSVVASDIINATHSSILMSGTLTPTTMYKEILGIERCEEAVFADPYPKENRINIIIPKTTTKYNKRNKHQYQQIGKICAELTNRVPGNSAIFFPSYYLKKQVAIYFRAKSEKTIFSEKPGMSKSEKISMLNRFKGYKATGAVLLGVSSGSFGEGIDLPGNDIKAVLIVGLPLAPPNLETKSLINYYDTRFNKGWDYGYLFPAMTKTIQNAGRCIRSEKDKGIIMFIDERYVWKSYMRCFPVDWKMVISSDYKRIVEEFFKEV